MTIKCAELINFSSGCILDIGCGSGHSITALNNLYESEEVNKKEKYFHVVGLDINKNMLDLCRKNGASSLIQCDIGKTLPFYPGSFDGVISVSCLQWLFYASDKDNVEQRLHNFLASLYSILKRDASACFQFYYEAKWQVDLLMKISKKVGFIGGIIIDGEGKNKKYYLVLDLTHKRRRVMPATHDVLGRKKKNTRKDQKSGTHEIDKNKNEKVTRNCGDSDSSSELNFDSKEKKPIFKKITRKNRKISGKKYKTDQKRNKRIRK